ncbi:predicted protein [Sclerotinia sclerotiorum 1980 UF-70]|uniref:Uncharacterized protein n=2 Tax=Sclerotinia sclerotiorum (strain ATCC 18683 / 1980 / Ss-1) TaxID=665079 RepID=A0A1D9Q6Y4_SCLS1|nr:predicted protein [Sclerotinia sclerotiorum 1980 UF-70]APA10691.1 hypothetical protein sscle_06g054610 [Sclerotinia sclerotiorum 1980 UF-70]EDN97602.1 predicted protein [Sclerotinia sclerotiorum 1980 UF-70]
MSASMCTTNLTHESETISKIEGNLLSKEVELYMLEIVVSIEEKTVLNLFHEAKRKRLEAKEFGSQWTEKSGALLSKKNQHELIVENIRMHTAYLEKIRGVEAGNKEGYTFEEHLKRENKELENKVESLQQALKAAKASMEEEISRLKADFDALVITNRHTSASLNQEIEGLKGDKEFLTITNSDTKISMGNVIDELKVEVASLTAINHGLTSTTEKHGQLEESRRKDFGHKVAQLDMNSQGARASFLESAKDSYTNKSRRRLDSGRRPSNNVSTTCDGVRRPSARTTSNYRVGGNPKVGDDCLVPALYKSVKSDLYDRDVRAPQAVADSHQGRGAQSNVQGWW